MPIPQDKIGLVLHTINLIVFKIKFKMYNFMFFTHTNIFWVPMMEDIKHVYDFST